MLQLNTLQHLLIQCNILQSLYRLATQIIILPANSPFSIQTGVRVPTECGAYIKLIQCSSLIQCNTWQYNVAFPNTLYRSHNQIVFLPAKHTVFRTILPRFSSECGAYNKLIQFYSLIHCNTWQYNVAFPNTLYRSHNQIVFLPAKHTVFRTILGRFSTEWAKVHEVDTILQESAMQQQNRNPLFLFCAFGSRENTQELRILFFHNP